MHTQINKFQQFLLLLLWIFKADSDVYMEVQSSREAKMLLHKNKKMEGLLHTKIYYKATVIKTVWSWCRDRWLGQCNGMESPERDPHIHRHDRWHTWHFSEQCKDHFLINSGEMIWVFIWENVKLDFHLVPYTKVNSELTESKATKLQNFLMSLSYHLGFEKHLF